MKQTLRGLFFTPLVRQFLAFCGAVYIRLAFRAIRWQSINDASQTLEDLVRDGPIIFCVWHGRQLMMPKLWPRVAQLWVVGSTSRDGQLALAAARQFNIKIIERSRELNSPNSARAIVRTLCSGHSVGITPDGSRGPGMKAKTSIIHLARLSGFPLVPATYSCTNAITLSSWDRFLIPLPFGRGIFKVGDPIHLEKTATALEVEAARLMLEYQLNSITDAADRAVGRRPAADIRIPQNPNSLLRESEISRQC